MSEPVNLAARRRQTRGEERARCLRDVRDELRGMGTLLMACITTLENHAPMPDVERQLEALVPHVEGLAARIEREL